jgi:hypothetical protein
MKRCQQKSASAAGCRKTRAAAFTANGLPFAPKEKLLSDERGFLMMP